MRQKTEQVNLARKKEIMKMETDYDYRTLLDLKKGPYLKFKLFSVNYNIDDWKKAKHLVCKKIVISMAEIIRCAIIHYLFIETLILYEDSNKNVRKSKYNRKTSFPIHISEKLKALIGQKYEKKPCSTVIRQMLHAYLKKIDLYE